MFRLVVQRQFGVVAGVAAYTLVQVVERNWVLILAGAVCGVVWGLLYAWKQNLTAPLLAHLIWTGALTFVWPLRGAVTRGCPKLEVSLLRAGVGLELALESLGELLGRRARRPSR